MAVSEEPKRTYRGNCHCTAFVYEVQLPEIKGASECNCSICVKKGTLWVIPSSRDDFRVVRGAESDLTSYNFGTGQKTHKFCGNCGTAIMVDAPNGPPGMKMVVNARSIQGLEIFGMARKPFDGAAFGAKYVPRPHKGPNPTAAVEDGKLYTGGCHCGAVTVAVVSKPIDETYSDVLIECNCSICERNGYVWAYFNADQVVLAGDDKNVGRYLFANHIVAKTFCKTCGVPLTNMHNPLTEEERKVLPDSARVWHERSKKLHPVNVKILNGVDFKSLRTQKLHGSAEHQPAYVNP
ncbi:Centromere protein V 1 [Colletotrichum chlorophyti]|uniref:Centromere protein V 1 n=1 Tax=Colletotrichum chlorophyti TaxID=708187 RepID=A0A1Q8RV95_9PEZI|nr:Centromere protein V 1 [Colletotrichum chlorophyti]